MPPNNRDQAPGEPALLEIHEISKSFPGVQALDSVSFELRSGEIHAIVGENGAGKSTLIKVLTGVHQADSGKIKLGGRLVSIKSPLEARALGIATIYQELTLIPSLSVRANLFLGNERTRLGFFNSDLEKDSSRTALAKLGSNLNPDALVADLTVGEQQTLEIARALLVEARVLVMDEPTAALAAPEVERLFSVLRGLREQGIGVIFISHRLDEVFEIADRVTVMRDGKTITTTSCDQLDRKSLIEHMVGRPLEEEFPKAKAEIGAPVLEVQNLSGAQVEDITFEVKRGEILGLAGLMGAGRTEVAKLIFGAEQRRGGSIAIDGAEALNRSPREAIDSGVCLLTEDRKSEGLVLNLSALENFALPSLAAWSRFGFVNQHLEHDRFRHRAQEFAIKVTGPEQRVELLSGGNQQKLLVARWLEVDTSVLLFDEPTRGIDVGAKYEIYQLIGRLAQQGKAIVVISSELPEMLGICDRIIVMREGRIAGEITDVTSATQQDIMALAV